jgi:hypothetical protein
MKRKTELLTNFNYFFIPMVEMLQKEFQSLCNSFLKIVRIEPANKVQSFFFKKRSLQCPEKHHFSYLSLH